MAMVRLFAPPSLTRADRAPAASIWNDAVTAVLPLAMEPQPSVWPAPSVAAEAKLRRSTMVEFVRNLLPDTVARPPATVVVPPVDQGCGRPVGGQRGARELHALRGGADDLAARGVGLRRRRCPVRSAQPWSGRSAHRRKVGRGGAGAAGEVVELPAGSADVTR